MIVNLNEIFEIANTKEIGIGAINVPNLETLKAAVSAAEELEVPIIIQHTEGHNHFISMEDVVVMMRYYAEKAKVPVCVHLDHGKSFEECKRAIDLGFTSVMFDGSLKSYEENIKESRKVVDYAHPRNITVESELGCMLNSEVGAGEGISSDSSEYQYTDPKEAKEFIGKTKVDCLAVAVGTIHGIYFEEPKLNLPRIKEIRDEVGIPLVLHGGSGLTEEQYKIAIKNGIRKINYYTYVNKAGGEAIRKQFESYKEFVFFDELSAIAEEAIKENIIDFLTILKSK